VPLDSFVASRELTSEGLLLQGTGILPLGIP